LFCEASNYAEEIEELGGGSGGYRREFKEWGAKLEVWRDLWKGQEALVMMSKKMWNVQSTWLKWECQLQSCILSTSRGLDIVHTFKKHDIMICVDHFWRCFLKCSVSCLLQDDYIYIHICVYTYVYIYIHIYDLHDVIRRQPWTFPRIPSHETPVGQFTIPSWNTSYVTY
jgi:hypothetical protein